MFYDDAFQKITENSPFSVTAVLTIVSGASSSAYDIKGIFCSGSYGMKDYDKGYSTAKSEKRQSFKMAAASLPSGVGKASIIRQTLTISSVAYTIREVFGNESGLLCLDLVEKN